MMMITHEVTPFKNIAFVGGIHGVGKSTICKKICSELNINYLSASEVLRWKEIKPNHKDKKVDDVSFTQDKLILGLSNIIHDGQFYLLDGHFCLLDSKNRISNIPLKTFQEINPISLNIIVGDIEEIRVRLNGRDELTYDCSLLEQMQANEINYAINLARILKKPLKFGTQNDFKEIYDYIKTSLKN